MTSILRTTALAAVLAASSWGAAAAPVVLKLGLSGFDDQFDAAKEPAKVERLNKVGFEGAWAYRKDILQFGDPAPGDDRPGNYISNRDRGSSAAQDVVISLDSGSGQTNPFPGQYLLSIGFSLFTSADELKISFADSNGNQLTSRLTPASSDMLWATGYRADFKEVDQIRQIRLSSDGAVLGLSDLELTLTEAIDPGVVPEPASYALVGLALLAAGTAGRRRRA